MLGRDLLGEVDHLGDMIGRDRPAAGLADIEVGYVLLEGRGIVRGDVPDALRLGAGSGFHLVVAGIGIEVRWPTSVMLMTWVRGKPFHLSTRLSVSVKT
jgi:hypothetical protein